MKIYFVVSELQVAFWNLSQILHGYIKEEMRKFIIFTLQYQIHHIFVQRTLITPNC